MKYSLLKYIVTAGAVMICLGMGKFVHAAVGGLPASLYGLILFTLVLSTEKLNREQIGSVSTKAIYYMPVVFLPVCVGVVDYLDLFAAVGFKMIIVGVTSTLIGVVIIAFSAHLIFTHFSAHTQKEKKEARHDH